MSTNLCRLCGNEKILDCISIFKDEGVEYELLQKINRYLPALKITENDKFSQYICYECTSSLNMWHQFYLNCVLIDKRLQSNKINTNNIKLSQKSLNTSYEKFEKNFQLPVTENSEVFAQKSVKRLNNKLERALIPCTECSNKFATVAMWENHKRHEHPPGGKFKKYTCNTCDIRFKSYLLYLDHMSSVHPQSNIVSEFNYPSNSINNEIMS